jgi:chromate transporter
MPGPLAAQLAIALGYSQRGFLGATAIGLAFVIPSFVMVVAISMAYRDNVQLKAFVQGATAAATGALAGAVVVLATRAIHDVPTVVIALASLAVLWRFKIPEPILVAAAGAIGLVVWPLVRGGI